MTEELKQKAIKAITANVTFLAAITDQLEIDPDTTRMKIGTKDDGVFFEISVAESIDLAHAVVTELKAA